MDDYGHACSASRDCTLHNLQCDYPDCAKGKRIGIHAAIGKPNYVQSPDFVAGFKAGREAGMREAAKIVLHSVAADEIDAVCDQVNAILSAIEGAK